MSISTQLGSLKYKCARWLERNPLLSNAIYNNIGHFKFLFPHEKDYYGIKLFCKSSGEKCFVDIGANIGLSSIGFRKLGFANRILMFEANPYLAGFVTALAAADGAMDTFQIALGNENTEREIYLAYYKGTCLHTFSSLDRDFILNSLKHSFPEKYRDIEVRSSKIPMRKFDDLKISQPPEFIKIDVEGFEHEILKGMAKTIENYKPVLLIEYNQANFPVVLQILKNDYALYSYDFEKNAAVIVDPADLSRLTDVADRGRIRNLFFVPVTRNENKKN